VEEEGAVHGRPVTRANEFLRQCAVFRDFGLGPDFQASPRSVIYEEEKNCAAGNVSAATPEASERKSPIVQHAEKALRSAVILSKWPAVLANTRKMEGIASTDERGFLGTDLRFYRAALRPSIVLRRSEAVQHRFHRWSKKSKINKVCFSGHIEVLKVCVDHCCELFANGVSRVPSPTFQKKFATWKLGGREGLFLSSCSPGNTSRSGGRKLNWAGGAMKASQILLRLFEHTGRHLALASLVVISVVSVHCVA
jgi:hypothetical protein